LQRIHFSDQGHDRFTLPGHLTPQHIYPRYNYVAL